KFGPKHKEHYAWLIDHGYADLDDECLNTHTMHLVEMCKHFGLPELQTAATGKEGAKGRNVAIYPDRRDGVWRAVRYNNVTEPTWPDKTANGHAMCLVGVLPPITVGIDVDLAVRQSIEALCGDDNTYQRGPLIEVAHDAPRPKLCLADNGAPQFRLIPAATLLRKLSVCARYQKWNAKIEDYVACLPSEAIINAVLASIEYPGIPVATGIVSSPILRADGTIATEPGYDALTGLYLDTSGTYPALMKPDDAVAKLKEVLIDFPFATEAHRSGWCAALVTLLCRAAFAGPSPFFLFDANMSRTGKGLLTDLLTMVAEERRAARYAVPKDGDELRKLITTIALSGAPYLLFDNIKDKFGNATIENAMTTGRWSDRILGGNRQIDIPLSVIWIGTSNNAVLTKDMIGRTCHVRMETNCERPDLRTGFKHSDLLGYVKEHRRELAVAALSIPAGFIAANKPDQNLPAWGGFEGWSDLVRNSLVWAGLPDPDTREALAAQADDDSVLLQQLMDGWAELNGAATVGEAVVAANLGTAPTLAALLTELPGDCNRSLGYLLRDCRGRVSGGRKLDRTDHKIPRWQLVTIAQAT
ncbi:MAG: hypothetical protein NT049_00050, partial [Planctomycetota bacterium]|nr:hypothetical protein [Planctomycetota bacterium]